jgi:hypothetical protein
MKLRLMFCSLLFASITSLTTSAAAEPKNSVTRGSARFEVLSANVVRMEYSRDRKFVDAPSIAVQNRNWTAPEFRAADSGGWLEITTSKSATGNPSPSVIGRLDYESESLPGAQVSYEIKLPFPQCLVCTRYR